MGVNRAGFGIIDDDVCKRAAEQEVIRRYIIAKCDYKKGKISEDAVSRSKLLMDDMNLKVEDRGVVLPAREYAEYKRNCDQRYENVVVMAMELSDGSMVTGRSSRRMVAAAACVLNAIKKLANIGDDIPLISPIILESIQHLKTEILSQDRSSLNLEEILGALVISSHTNPAAELAAQKLGEVRSLRAHCTAILSDRDEQTLRALGVDVTSDPEYVTTNLYFS
jgi:uncharacterized protein (UPF0371 family)